ncbi:MAG: hypothetical protein IPM82_10590 [Saprospiraceae bacterium]|nr:hypothetical protein [Saprospiraceae bacterium]
MKKGLLPIVFCLLILPVASRAQFDEVGIIFGCSNYSGDLTERDIEPLECNMANGIYVRKKLNRQFGLKMQIARLVLSGNDANNTMEGGLWKRNLSFRSDLYEFGAQVEWVPISLKTGDNQFMPYFFTGIAAFYFNPQAEMGGNVYNLHHYQTEGVEYSLFQFAIPFGAGIKLNLRNRGSLGFELGLRKTFTDYLDDVSNTYRSDIRLLGENNSLAAQLSYRGIEGNLSDAPLYPKPGTQRGNPDKMDWYALFGMTIGVNLSR